MNALSLPASPGLVDEAGLQSYGEALGAALPHPAIVVLRGELGAGKTTLAQAIARGLGVAENVTSPTFALVHEYVGADVQVFHIDLYRLRSADELVNIGWDEIVGGEGIVLIEWPERAGARLPAPRLDITLTEVAASLDRRHVEATWVG